jgi:hypothetical protein
VVQHLAATDTLINDGRWHLALAETRDLDFFRDVLVGVVKTGLELLRGDRNAEADTGGTQGLFCGGGHSFSPTNLCFFFPSGRQDLNLRLPAPKAGALPS